ncbi:glycosyltransferase family 4 protein [Roseiterribacter gracilis]|uniref:Glycosyl transferase family 1 n=1 Tax=Roseiterribacter gracilis TaxID=2812848 RepID=A0A8S8X856_9PROT|nr:glycosyl transferase family 1 [Rhodospirillales bacterium TMPK1]
MAHGLAINGRFLTQAGTGVQRFAAEIVGAWDALLADGTIHSSDVTILSPPGARKLNLQRITQTEIGSRGGYGWEQWDLPRAVGARSLVSLCNLGPLLTRRQALVIHDATPRAMPNAFSRSFKLAYSVLEPLLCRRVASLVTVTEFSRREIARYYWADEERIAVVGEGADHIDRITSDVRALEKHGLTRHGYFLGVGLGGRNKNTPALVEAYAQLQGKTNATLALVGRADARVHPTLPAPQGAKVLGFVDDAELKALYENALGLVYPSLYEGFGLPPVEAMRSGCAVLVSDQEALVEVGGDGVFATKRGDTNALAAAMLRLETDPAWRATLAARGRARTDTMTWRAAALRLWKTLP